MKRWLLFFSFTALLGLAPAQGAVSGQSFAPQHLDPVTERFLSADPSRFTDNLYALCGNDPINFVDPDGRLATGVRAGAVQGDYAEYATPEQAFGGFVGQVGAGFTPAGWAGDVRDFTAAIGNVKSQGLSFGTGAGVVLSGIAFVPVIGDPIKGLLKPLIKVADDVPVNRIIDDVNLPSIRQQYVDEVRVLEDIGLNARSAGQSSEDTARMLSQMRRDLGVQYKDMTPSEELAAIYKANIRDYGDPLGPTIEWFRERGKTWEQIIESASRPGNLERVK